VFMSSIQPHTPALHACLHDVVAYVDARMYTRCSSEKCRAFILTLAKTPKASSHRPQEIPATREAQRVSTMTPLFWANVVLGSVVARAPHSTLKPAHMDSQSRCCCPFFVNPIRMDRDVWILISGGSPSVKCFSSENLVRHACALLQGLQTCQRLKIPLVGGWCTYLLPALLTRNMCYRHGGHHFFWCCSLFDVQKQSATPCCRCRYSRQTGHGCVVGVKQCCTEIEVIINTCYKTCETCPINSGKDIHYCHG
jgi:hypothetical protein